MGRRNPVPRPRRLADDSSNYCSSTQLVHNTTLPRKQVRRSQVLSPTAYTCNTFASFSFFFKFMPNYRFSILWMQSYTLLIDNDNQIKKSNKYNSKNKQKKKCFTLLTLLTFLILHYFHFQRVIYVHPINNDAIYFDERK